MKAKGRIDPRELEKLGFKMGPTAQEEDANLSYHPRQDLKKKSSLKDPYPSQGKIGPGKHGRAASNIDIHNGLGTS